jgi:hypothetical protein
MIINFKKESLLKRVYLAYLLKSVSSLSLNITITEIIRTDKTIASSAIIVQKGLVFLVV